MSARQKIEEVLKKTPDISLDKLNSMLPDINPVTLKSDFYKLKRKLFGPVKSSKPKKEKPAKKKSHRLKVFEYLNKNRETAFDTLQSTFSDIKQTTLRNYLSTWKNEQKAEPKKKQPKKQLNKSQKPKSSKEPIKRLSARKTQSDSSELIESLKMTIAAQEKTIQTMKKTIELLSPEGESEELKGMTLSEVKKIAATYLKSIKELPAKMRR